MARRARLVLPSVPLHIIQRGNNRHPCFIEYGDYKVYLSMLQDCAVRTDCEVHAYVLMTNHVHLLVTPLEADSASELMKILGQRYVQYINRKYIRTGTLWEGRFRSCLVEDARYLLTCYRYIELNPVRAGIVGHPMQYRWSSYRSNAEGVTSKLIKPHLTYQHLGPIESERLDAYRALFQDELSAETLTKLRRATNGNYAFGGRVFASRAEELLQRPTEPQCPGRPKIT
ncbi:transposase [Massilia cavernae]|uniref:Transposase n=1 Tax=Massilia cavernae TaxID=2320864 RepID=A0A418XSZ4_9BURK|nr:transposase [Massilia cavernae]RJG15576.1 transposase [Massilia cavernae]